MWGGLRAEANRWASHRGRTAHRYVIYIYREYAGRRYDKRVCFMGNEREGVSRRHVDRKAACGSVTGCGSFAGG